MNRLFVVIALSCVVAAPAFAGNNGNKLDQKLQSAQQSGGNAPQSVIVRVQPGQLAAAQTRLAALGGKITTVNISINTINATVPAGALNGLNGESTVLSVSTNGTVTGLGNGNSGSSGATGVDVLRATQGLTSTSPTGKNVGVAIIDSGIAPGSDFNGHIVAFYDYVKAGGALAAAYDDYGHGTHVAGLIASSGALGSQYQGLAPGVNLVIFKVLNAQGQGQTSDVINALTFATANKTLLGIDVINLSLGHPIYESAATDPLVQAVEAAVRSGIVVVTAAGNFGEDANGNTGYAGITSPGNAPSAITVGAFEDQGTVGRGDDIVAPYSSSGPTWYDGFAKPDILANGHRLVSNASRGQYLYTNYPQFAVDANHLRLSGTSMATAVATGAVADLLQASRTANGYPARPSLTPNAVKAILQYTAFSMTNPATGAAYDALTQ
ncbi:MAG TPA: S8 family serine peptidase, partial [Vicinamibacterales bacterium]|nr:S8 family serine peptidase [Vicinamibacterales bacterium]